jgi:alkylation response protein AidB-like acyl-CoA dehydrogenase
MATELDAARMLVWQAANALAPGARGSAKCSMAKAYSTEMAVRTTRRAAQMHGLGGFVAHTAIERHGRDARVTEILGGASDIQRSVVASDLLTQ